MYIKCFDTLFPIMINKNLERIRKMIKGIHTVLINYYGQPKYFEDIAGATSSHFLYFVKDLIKELKCPMVDILINPPIHKNKEIILKWRYLPIKLLLTFKLKFEEGNCTHLNMLVTLIAKLVNYTIFFFIRALIMEF